MAQKPMPSPAPSRSLAWTLFALVVVTLGMRSAGYLRAFHHGHVIFFGNDSWCHMRRIEFAVRHDLRVPEFDPYLNFPQGGTPVWGGLFDHLIAGAAVLSGAAYLDQHSLEVFCAWAPAVMGALCVLPLFFLAYRWFGLREAVAAGVFLALLPSHAQYTLLGNLDHHVLECLFFGASSAAILWLCDAPPGQILRRTLVAALLIWLLFLTHPALGCLYIGVVWCGAAVSAWSGRLARGAGWAFFLPAVLLLPYAFESIAGFRGMSRLSATPSWVMYEQLSFLHPLLLIFCGLSVMALAEKGRARVVLSLAALGSLAALAWPLSAGSVDLFKHDPWLKYIAETRPILIPSPEAGWDASFTVQVFSYWFFAFPLWWVWVWRAKRDLFLNVWTAAVFLLVNLQLRFMPIAAYALAIALASTLVWAWDRMRGTDLGRCVLGALLIAGLWPCLAWQWSLAKGSRYKYMCISDQFYEMMEALRANSPTTQGYEDADKKPEYGVIAPWDFGHAIIYLAHRAVVADPLGHGLTRSYRYYSAATPREALSQLQDIRYVVAQDLSYSLTHHVMSDYLHLPEGHPMHGGDWHGLFHMKILLDAPMKDGNGRPTTWGHRLVYRSLDGGESLYEIDQTVVRRNSDLVN